MACKSAIIRDLCRHYSLESRIGIRQGSLLKGVMHEQAPLRQAIQVDNNIQIVKAVSNTSNYQKWQQSQTICCTPAINFVELLTTSYPRIFLGGGVGGVFVPPNFQ